MCVAYDLAGDPLLHGRGAGAEQPGGVCADPGLRVSHPESGLDLGALLSSKGVEGARELDSRGER